MAHVVDTHVGQRIRERRLQLEMSQVELASAVGVRFQQIQKYETGGNRVSASRLWDIAANLNVPVSYFFSGLERSGDNTVSSKAAIELDESVYRIAVKIMRLPVKFREIVNALVNSLAEEVSNKKGLK